jgi:hypothetical protein
MHPRVPREWCNGAKAASGTALSEAASSLGARHQPSIIDSPMRHGDALVMPKSDVMVILTRRLARLTGLSFMRWSAGRRANHPNSPPRRAGAQVPPKSPAIGDAVRLTHPLAGHHQRCNNRRARSARRCFILTAAACVCGKWSRPCVWGTGTWPGPVLWLGTRARQRYLSD